MGEWKFERTTVITHKYIICGVQINFMKNSQRFRELRKDKDGKCEMCKRKFTDNQYMHLALNSGKFGNLLICDSCRDEAESNGVECVERGGI